jgi:hypothetical protein
VSESERSPEAVVSCWEVSGEGRSMAWSVLWARLASQPAGWWVHEDRVLMRKGVLRQMKTAHMVVKSRAILSLPCCVRSGINPRVKSGRFMKILPDYEHMEYRDVYTCRTYSHWLCFCV